MLEDLSIREQGPRLVEDREALRGEGEGERRPDSRVDHTRARIPGRAPRLPILWLEYSKGEIPRREREDAAGGDRPPRQLLVVSVARARRLLERALERRRQRAPCDLLNAGHDVSIVRIAPHVVAAQRVLEVRVADLERETLQRCDLLACLVQGESVVEETSVGPLSQDPDDHVGGAHHLVDGHQRVLQGHGRVDSA